MRVTSTPLAPMELPPAPEPTAEDPEQSAAVWVQQLLGEPLWAQVQLLDDAMAGAEDPGELQVLEEAQAKLLRENPPLAVRRAVVRLAIDHPIGVCAGGVGLLLAVAGLFRGAFRLAF